MIRCLRPLYLLTGLALLSLYGCPPVNWVETYRIDERNPFDLYVLYELLEARPEPLTVIEDTTDLDQLVEVTGSNYLFIGHQPHYDQRAVTQLLDYVERGNTAFLAAEEIPEDLAYHLFGDDCYYSEYFDDYYYTDFRFPTVEVDTVNAYHYPSGDSFQLVNIRYWQPMYTSLTTVNDLLLCDETLDIQVLGSLDTFGTNYLRIGWGQGDFYFHSNPRFFTNWFMLDSVEYRYPEAMLSVIGEGPVIWDEYHRRYRRPPAAGNNSTQAQRQYNGGRNLLNGNDTLLYIQERRELAFAWYTLLGGALLFVIFRGRRRQRVIPIIPPRENSSRRFIDTISRLVAQKGNHHALARRELGALRFHLNTRLGLAWSEGQPPPDDLATRVNLPTEAVERALSQIRLVTSAKSIKEGDLLRFYRAIEPLYRV